MKDILLDKEKDLEIINGDFAIGESSQQEIDLLLTSFPGEWKENPKTGAGIQKLLKSRESSVRINTITSKELEADGFSNVDIKINYPDININADRT